MRNIKELNYSKIQDLTEKYQLLTPQQLKEHVAYIEHLQRIVEEAQSKLESEGEDPLSDPTLAWEYNRAVSFNPRAYLPAVGAEGGGGTGPGPRPVGGEGSPFGPGGGGGGHEDLWCMGFGSIG